MRNIIFVFLILSNVFAFSQDNRSDLELISLSIQNYFEGYIERDITKLNNAFDIVNGTMKVPIKKNDTTIGYENLFFRDLMPKWGNRKKLSSTELLKCTLEILNIDLEQDKIATAKIMMTVVNTVYIDILSLQNINGQWKITNKMYYVKDE